MKSKFLNIPPPHTEDTTHSVNKPNKMSNGTSLCIGLTNVFSPHCTFATLVCPSFPGKTSTIRPSGQFPRDNPGYTSNTTSPIFKFFSTSYHFGLAVNIGKYSLSHLCHTMDTKCCTFLQRCLGRKPSQTCSGANCPPI